MDRKSLDEKFKVIALRLAAKAKGWTSPNPMVRAILLLNSAVSNSDEI
jgi:pyrimidine deaminase RibD-like protein